MKTTPSNRHFRRQAIVGSAAAATLVLVTLASPPSVATTAPEAAMDTSSTSLVLDPPMPSFGAKVKARVRVESTGAEPTGTVTITDGNDVLASDTLWTRFSSGKVTITLPRDLTVGRRSLVVTYSGNDQINPSTGRAKINVLRSSPKIRMTTKSWTVKKGSRPKVTVRVSGPAGGPHPVGTVLVRQGSYSTKATLVNGTAKLKLGKVLTKTRMKVIFYTKKTGFTRAWKYYTFKTKR